VRMILLLQPEHEHQLERHVRALATAIKGFGLRYGPYPYPTITLVDPAWGAGGSGGMEYPRFITAGTDWLAPDDDHSGFFGASGPELVTVHEFGHQYWQTLVATNEFEEAWLDEGLNTYSTGLILDEVYGPTRQHLPANQIPLPVDRWLGLAPLTQRAFARVGPVLDRGGDAIARHAWEFGSRESYAYNSYAKTAAMLLQLEAELGSDVMERVLRRYHQRWRFGHPGARDFVAMAEEVSGRDLVAFFERFVFEPGTLDFAVTRARSVRLGYEAGVIDEPEGRITRTPEEAAERLARAEKEDAPDRFRSTVVVTRHGSIRWPVEVLVRFADGHEEREHWDGAYRRARFVYERPARLERVVVDPDERILFDLNPANDSWVDEPELPGRLRWSLHLWIQLQHLLLGLAGLLA